jgi:hypothetical protein
MRAQVLALLMATSASAAAPPRVAVDFRTPASRRVVTIDGAHDGRFTWSREGLRLELDSNAPTSRAVVPLRMTLDGTTSFAVEVDLVLEDLQASPEDFFQVAFGLMNQTTTGLNRTGTSLNVPPFFVDDADCFDSVELAYFPNVTFFGGPFLQPTVFGAQVGPSAFGNFAANFGPSADLGDNGPGEVRELPTGVPLRVRMIHDACRQQLVTRVFDLSGRDPVELLTGIQPVDLSFLDATGTFTVDALALHAWQDLADFDPSTPSLTGHVLFQRASVERLAEPSARVLPRAINARARGGARLWVELPAGDEDPAIKLVSAGGVALDLPLDCRAAAPGAWTCDMPRGVIADPLVLDAAGCTLVVPAHVLP